MLMLYCPYLAGKTTTNEAREYYRPAGLVLLYLHALNLTCTKHTNSQSRHSFVHLRLI